MEKDNELSQYTSVSLVPSRLIMTLAQGFGLCLDTAKSAMTVSEDTLSRSQRSLSSTCLLCCIAALALVWKAEVT